MTLSIYENIYRKLFGKTWPIWLGGVILAFINILLFLYLIPLGGVYPAMADWGIWTYRLVRLKIEPPWGSLELPYLSIRSVINFGLLLGALIGALLSKEFMIRKATIGTYIQSSVGGALMGIGSFLAGACIIGGFYSSIMALSLSGFYMMIGLILGGYIGGKVTIWQKSKKAKNSVSDVKAAPNDLGEKDSKSHLPKIGVFVTIILLVIALAYFLSGKNLLGGVALFSAAFGLVFQRSDFGFSTAFREIFTTKNNKKMRGVIISLIVGVIGFSIIKASAFKPAFTFVSPAGWHSVLGGVIFGFGMVIADG